MEQLESIKRLARDVKSAAVTLSHQEARFLVDTYYGMQDERIRADGQVRAMEKSEEPHSVLSWLSDQSTTLENQIKRALDAYSASHPLGEWARSIYGIGPVIAAGLLAHIDIAKAPTAGHIWNFAGLNPDVKWEKGKKRPWNATLKLLCCLPGTVITTQNGASLIENVQVGEMVLTHKGRWKPVTKVFKNSFSGTAVRLRAHGLANGPFLTGNHPVLVKKMRTHEWQDGERMRFRALPRVVRSTQIDDAAWSEIEHRIADGEPGRRIANAMGCSEALVSKIRHGYTRQPTKDVAEWCRADGITPGWRIMSPTPPFCGGRPLITLTGFPRLRNPATGLQFEVTYDVARMVGLFIGDGHTSLTNVYWSFGLQESHLSSFVIRTLKDVFGIRAMEKVTHNMRIVFCGSKQLSTWMNENIRKYSAHKTIPIGWVSANREVATGLLRGMFDSDGTTGDQVSYCTVNHYLAQSCAQMLRAVGIPASVSKGEYATGFSTNRVYYKVTPSDLTSFYDIIMGQAIEPVKTTAVAERCGHEAWHTARESLTLDYTGTVYNLEVEEDHSYVASGFAVHNCWKIGESFVKVSGNENDFYGKIYAARKLSEIAKNDAGEFSPQAAAALLAKKFGADTQARKFYEEGKLPPAHIHARAKRYAVKLFLSHYQHVGWVLAFNEAPPKPYVMVHMGHAHYIPPPNFSQLIR